VSFPANGLYIFNHFLTNPVASPLFSRVANTQALLTKRAKKCQAAVGHIANFVTVDYWSIGKGYEATNAINGV
jgi:hypothetical protein